MKDMFVFFNCNVSNVKELNLKSHTHMILSVNNFILMVCFRPNENMFMLSM